MASYRDEQQARPKMQPGDAANGDVALADALEKRARQEKLIFKPGMRIKMNAVPMVLAVLVPWGFYTAIFLLYTSSWPHTWPAMVYTIIGFFVALWLAGVYWAWKARITEPNPMWYTYFVIVLPLAIGFAIGLGEWLFSTYFQEYYELSAMRSVTSVDATAERGENLMDASIIYFAEDNRIDATRSWHFKHGTIYCVAPIRGAANDTVVHDFWAVGEDCCPLGSSDFRCGDVTRASARSGIRALRDNEWYTLAVHQAVALYGIAASHPIFVHWERDPLKTLNAYLVDGKRRAANLVAAAFVLSLFIAMCATAGYMWIGRRENIYGTDILGDPRFRQGIAYQYGTA